jgi:hypothetical protein
MPTASLCIQERLRLHMDINVNQSKFVQLETDNSSKNLKKNLIKYYNSEFLEIKAKLDTLFINFKNKCNEFVSPEYSVNKENMVLLIFSSFNIFSFDVHYWIETYIATVKSYKEFLNISVYNYDLFTKEQLQEVSRLLNKMNFFLFKTVSNNIIEKCRLLANIAYEHQLEYTSFQREKIDHFFNLIDYFGGTVL